ncbi:MAG: domain containing protein [Bacteroidetes bacterium]|jgi:PKD repeat protein|nr:domain containing protein [Bacteroidota bacterium]
MTKFYISILFLFSFSIINLNAQEEGRATTCDVLMAKDPITRTVTLGEENVVAGNFQALAQQYNGLTGQIKGVRFWGRTNPAAGVPTNIVKVVLYNVNQGKPNQILTQTTVTLDSSSTSYEVNAVFPTPYTITTTSIILSIEPLFPTTDNYFIVRNGYGDGLNLNMSKIKQAGLWYLGAAEGYDMDFYIFPVGTATVTSNFTTNTSSAFTASFTNTSTSATSYLWDFGDGTTSTATTPPPHTYSSANTYSVKLVAYHSDITCADSIVKSVTVLTTGINEKNKNKNSLSLLKNPVQNVLTVTSSEDSEIGIYNVMGSLILKEKIKSENPLEINVSEFIPGVYFIQTEKGKATKFIKVN